MIILITNSMQLEYTFDPIIINNLNHPKILERQNRLTFQLKQYEIISEDFLKTKILARNKVMQSLLRIELSAIYIKN